jgi:hypothetical protein
MGIQQSGQLKRMHKPRPLPFVIMTLRQASWSDEGCNTKFYSSTLEYAIIDMYPLTRGVQAQDLPNACDEYHLTRTDVTSSEVWMT